MTFYFELIIGLTVIHFIMLVISTQWPCCMNSSTYPRIFCKGVNYLVTLNGFGLLAALVYFRFSHPGKVCSGTFLQQIYGAEFEESNEYKVDKSYYLVLEGQILFVTVINHSVILGIFLILFCWLCCSKSG